MFSKKLKRYKTCRIYQDHFGGGERLEDVQKVGRKYVHKYTSAEQTTLESIMQTLVGVARYDNDYPPTELMETRISSAGFSNIMPPHHV